ncbi:Endonuclease III [Nitrospira sp. KM1]|uniref:endonuclease III n=1 Tax=Nitrospira sp. KM1 TaxID=1936990 RepID=UPI0013A72CF0|nr:endonuclease III [Nitrospira sp. KM1]BCA53526.1 Endonuclease III [Nitrospira sp. KM1]
MAPRRTRESDQGARARRIGKLLGRSMPDAKVELQHRSPWELLVATILSAQCTDARVNQVTPVLFQRFPTPETLARAETPEVEPLIRSTGFFKSKARSIVMCARAVTERFHGRVPSTMEELVTLPGVGRKTANVLLGNVFGKPAIIVDTHVKRVANRLAFTRSEDPDRIEEDLQQLLPQSEWTAVSQRILLHGRYVCTARLPQCGRCPIYSECPWKEKSPR